MGTAKPLVHRALQLAAWSPFRSDSPHHSEPKRVSSTSIEPACHGGSASRQLIWNCAVCRLATRWPPSAPGLHRQLIKAIITPTLITLSCSSHASFTHPRAPRVHADFDLTVTVVISRNHRLFDTTASLHVEFHPPYINRTDCWTSALPYWAALSSLTSWLGSSLVVVNCALWLKTTISHETWRYYTIRGALRQGTMPYKSVSQSRCLRIKRKMT